MPAMSAASRTSGTSANSHVRPGELTVGAIAPSRITAGCLRPEQPHPAELRGLALVRVEHEVARVAERRFEHRPFALAQHHGIGVIRDAPSGARAEGIEKHAMQVKAVDQIELGEIDQVNTHEAADL